MYVCNQHIREATVIKQANKEDEYPINLEFNETTFRVLFHSFRLCDY